MPHQLIAYRWAKHRRNIALFLEMRLGKSLVSLRWANTRPHVKRILIVAPLSVGPSWQAELEREGFSMVSLTGTAAQRKKALESNSDARWFFINYEGLTKSGHKTAKGKSRAVPSDYALLPWDCVILDESTRIRSPKAQITKVCLKTLSTAPYKCILTGLPDPEGVDNFVTQLLFLFDSFMGCADYWQWKSRYMRNIYLYEYILTNNANKLLNAELKNKSLMMSRKEAGLGNKKIYEKRFIDLPKKVLKAIEEVELEYEIGGRLTSTSLVTYTWIAQLIGGTYPGYEHTTKVKEVKYLLTTELKGEPIIIWARFTDEIKLISAELTKIKINHGVVTGEFKRYNATTIKKFQVGKIDVLVLQPKCALMGIDLSRSSTAIYYSNYYDLEIREQTRDRIEHPKKKELLLIIDLVARDTLDESVIESLKDKKQSSKTFISNLGNFIKRRKNIAA